MQLVGWLVGSLVLDCLVCVHAQAFCTIMLQFNHQLAINITLPARNHELGAGECPRARSGGSGFCCGSFCCRASPRRSEHTSGAESSTYKNHTLAHATRLHAHTSNQYAVPSKRSHPIRGPIQEAASLPTRKHTSQDHVYRNDGWLIVVSVCCGLMHSSGHLNRCTCYNIIQCLDFKRTSARTEPLEHGVGNRTPLCNISDMKYQRHATTLQMQMCTICQPTTHPIQQPTSQPHLHPSF